MENFPSINGNWLLFLIPKYSVPPSVYIYGSHKLLRFQSRQNFHWFQEGGGGMWQKYRVFFQDLRPNWTCSLNTKSSSEYLICVDVWNQNNFCKSNIIPLDYLGASWKRMKLFLHSRVRLINRKKQLFMSNKNMPI